MDDSEGRLSLIGASIEPQPDQHQPTSGLKPVSRHTRRTGHQQE